MSIFTNVQVSVYFVIVAQSAVTNQCTWCSTHLYICTSLCLFCYCNSLCCNKSLILLQQVTHSEFTVYNICRADVCEHLYNASLQRICTTCKRQRTTTRATHCNILQQHTAVSHCNTLQHTTTCCNTLQHTATCCNWLAFENPRTLLPKATRTNISDILKSMCVYWCVCEFVCACAYDD